LSELDARARAAGLPFEQVVLRREIRGGIDALVGVTSDPLFGPLLVLRYGGLLAEIVQDPLARRVYLGEGFRMNVELKASGEPGKCEEKAG
jgi:acyl-CoA synthetase (NDP forming)